MFEAYSDSLYDIFLKIRNNKQSQASRTEITKVRDSFKLSVEYMREICQETGLSITEGKRIQRQQRYDRLKEEFNKLIHRLCTNNAFGTNASPKRGDDKD